MLDVEAINTNDFQSDLKLPCKIGGYKTNYEKVVFSDFKKCFGEEKAIRRTGYEKQAKIQILISKMYLND